MPQLLPLLSASLAASARGGTTGIALSHCALGDGVNADNIVTCLAMLRDRGYAGALSLECEGAAGPMIMQSLGWIRQQCTNLGIPLE